MPKKFGIIVAALFAALAIAFVILPAFGISQGYIPAVAFGIVAIVAASFCFSQPGFLQETDGSISNRRVLASICVTAAIVFLYQTISRGLGWIGIAASGVLLLLAAISVGLITISEIKAIATQVIDKKLG